uniref:Uncharacterized protein n=1 Tax=Panagrolaimus davidi TaxID=227884 RepID=A0A914Q6Z9_9BILA
MRQSQLFVIFLFVGIIALSKGSQENDSSQRIYLLKRFPISQNIYFGSEDPTIDALQNLIGNDLQEKRGIPISLTNDKRAIPMSGGIYGKRSLSSFFGINDNGDSGEIETVKRAALPFSGGIYGKRAMNIPFSGGIYGKRSIALRSIPISGGIYG